MKSNALPPSHDAVLLANQFKTPTPKKKPTASTANSSRKMTPSALIMQRFKHLSYNSKNDDDPPKKANPQKKVIKKISSKEGAFVK